MGMLALEANMERERCALRDRQVRLHSVHTDLELDLPTSVHLPDGEEIPYGSSTRLHIRDPEQQSEIYRKCIRPPPNRTIEQSEPILPCRSNSTSLLSCGSTTSSNNSSDWGQNMVRCHSMSSRYNAALNTYIPPVILPIPSKSHHHQHHHHHHQQVSTGLAQITMVPCLTDRRSSSSAVAAANFENHQNHPSENLHNLQSDGGVVNNSKNSPASGNSTSSSSSSSSSTSTTRSLSSMDANSRLPMA